MVRAQIPGPPGPFRGRVRGIGNTPEQFLLALEASWADRVCALSRRALRLVVAFNFLDDSHSLPMESDVYTQLVYRRA